MTFTFRPAIRESVGLIIGLAGASGSGKTFSAMLLAKGICGNKGFCVIDTEAGRANHYADQFQFDHGDLKPPFRPSAYSEAIKAADESGYPVIVIDSVSHEHAGEGGLLDWHEEELHRMAGEDWKKREAYSMAGWVKPKMAHKQMMQRLLQVRAHLILCFRAEEKIEMVKGADGKTKIVPKGWMPICEKNMPYELTASFLLTPDAPGMPKPLKLQNQHRPFITLDQPLNEEFGKRIAEWATGTPRDRISIKPDVVTSVRAQSPAMSESADSATPDDEDKKVLECAKAIKVGLLANLLEEDCFTDRQRIETAKKVEGVTRLKTIDEWITAAEVKIAEHKKAAKVSAKV